MNASRVSKHMGSAKTEKLPQNCCCICQNCSKAVVGAKLPLYMRLWAQMSRRRARAIDNHHRWARLRAVRRAFDSA